MKLNGYRMLTRIENSEVNLITRNGHDWTSRMGHLRKVLEALPVDNVWLDGEVIMPAGPGKPDFNALQNAFVRHSTTQHRL